jgi:rhamnopyranosyl-N-acetylglucosaminyl-diphospho-decaprenol beta-1,3/1,4-galactofuranosyltransferase
MGSAAPGTEKAGAAGAEVAGAEVARADADAAGAGMRIAAVVVSHNRKAQLRRTVARLLAEGVDHLVVVDNASTDGTRDWLAGLADARLHVILSPRNLGGAGGFERGLRAARALHDPDWYVVMDDDARPHAGTIARFRTLAAAAPEGTGPGGTGPEAAGRWDALAAGVYYPDGAICETNRPSRNPFWCRRSFFRTLMGGGRAGFHVEDADYAVATPLPIDAASFVGLFLSRAAIARAGYPQGELFIYGDDVLYTLGLSRAGGRIGFAPWLGFEHDCTTFRRGEGQIHRPLWKVFYNYRNGLFAYRAAAGPVLFWLVLLLSLPKWALKVRGYAPAERRTYLQLLGIAVGDGLRGWRGRPHRQVRAIARHGERRDARPAGTLPQPAPRDAAATPGE